ncbi:gliding motility-associated C-terminal domain-containing protein [Lacinutrix sp. C3R15]|uniref:gliding motility-associated C-terminal domain-containing protein n=1 Tax=Flavobacteriaceae TaxID=49546 RepID=UPI001C0911C9|nr:MULTISPECIES: gliding motility-associated C-terminal domain-containing protein [Flavobacteriaceae]MBU2937962.1 gliding motility-associated C-terminal domain-containing protein [Lacinutrix sp. C3R15]MDO6621276.1 gliding motility-associated C-terminal domain-containing protein [Oceanihabitans sp. 1_MG-2023]
MKVKTPFFLFLFFHFITSYSQTTDVSIAVVAQDLSGNDISQIPIFEQFQYLVTISNSGNSVSNVSFSQTINTNATIVSYISQNPIGGTTLITNFSQNANVITGTITSLPAASSIEVKVIVRAPEIIGGIATNANVTPPTNSTDTNTGNNTSIISIDVTDVPIDFTITQTQISPPEGTAISTWNDTVTYEFTITNHSSIAYPLNGFTTFLSLNTPQSYGKPFAQLLSVNCINATGGTNCIDTVNITPTPVIINSSAEVTIFDFEESHEYSAGGSLTFEMVYQYLEPECAEIIDTINVTSSGEISLMHSNLSANSSNTITTNLVEAQLCQETDVCIETVQINPLPVNTEIAWNEPITFETTICNNGPLDADVLVSFRNQSNNAFWNIISITCEQNSTTIPCSSLSFADADQYWVSNLFNMPVGEIVTIKTVIVFLEPECIIGSLDGIIRTAINIESDEVTDSDFSNNTDFDYINLPTAEECDSSDIEVTKTQINPVLPEGETSDNTTSWGSITYEVTVSNLSENATIFELIDYIPTGYSSTISASLESVTCVATTGTASCFPIENANIGLELDGIYDDDENNPDLFWQILPEENRQLPALSSITFHVIVNWFPVCSAMSIPATNLVQVDALAPYADFNQTNNNASTTTYFAPCIDLIVQTFPEFPVVTVNQPFHWIVDITNSTMSSSAVEVAFENELDAIFNIVGTPTCVVTSGTAGCITSFSITGNHISAIIPSMEAGATVRIFIPVEAPAFGGAFINTSEAIPSAINNEELTPETNISISSVQVLAPTLEKIFNPEEIFEGEESILSFTVFNLPSNTAQTNINFTDNLPTTISIAGDAYWSTDNGCTATFVGEIGDTAFQVTNLTFPEGVASCTFSIPVTSNTAGNYTNNNSNVSNQNNIDTSNTNAMLTVLAGSSTNTTENCLEIPQGFSPNNDGTNDVFSITCIEEYPNAKLQIYNRHGALVYKNNNYLNSWDGRPNHGVLHNDAKRLPVGTYFYVLEHKDLPKQKIGWVYLNY